MVSYHFCNNILRVTITAIRLTREKEKENRLTNDIWYWLRMIKLSCICFTLENDFFFCCDFEFLQKYWYKWSDDRGDLMIYYIFVVNTLGYKRLWSKQQFGTAFLKSIAQVHEKNRSKWLFCSTMKTSQHNAKKQQQQQQFTP